MPKLFCQNQALIHDFWVGGPFYMWGGGGGRSALTKDWYCWIRF